MFVIALLEDVQNVIPERVFLRILNPRLRAFPQSIGQRRVESAIKGEQRTIHIVVPKLHRYDSAREGKPQLRNREWSDRLKSEGFRKCGTSGNDKTTGTEQMSQN